MTDILFNRTRIAALPETPFVSKMLRVLPGYDNIRESYKRVRVAQDINPVDAPTQRPEASMWSSRILDGEEPASALADGVDVLSRSARREAHQRIIRAAENGHDDAVLRWLREGPVQAALAAATTREFERLRHAVRRVLDGEESEHLGPSAEEVDLNRQARKLAPALGIDPPEPIEIEQQPPSKGERIGALQHEFRDAHTAFTALAGITRQRWPFIDVLDSYAAVWPEWWLIDGVAVSRGSERTVGNQYQHEAANVPWPTLDALLIDAARNGIKFRARTKAELAALTEQLDAESKKKATARAEAYFARYDKGNEYTPPQWERPNGL